MHCDVPTKRDFFVMLELEVSPIAFFGFRMAPFLKRALQTFASFFQAEVLLQSPDFLVKAQVF